MVDTSVGVVDSVVYAIVCRVNWGSNGVIDLGDDISIVSVGVDSRVVNSVAVDVLGIRIGITLAKMVDTSIGVVDSVVYSVVSRVDWGSNGAVDLWEGISVVSVSVDSSVVNSVAVEVLGVSFGFTFAKMVDTSVGVVDWHTISGMGVGSWGNI